MSDPVSNAEIEDVLSSIRRLVSEDHRVAPQPEAREDAAGERLVLTPSFRVPEPAEHADEANEADTDSAPQHAKDAASDDALGTSYALDSFEITARGASEDDDAPAPWTDPEATLYDAADLEPEEAAAPQMDNSDETPVAPAQDTAEEVMSVSEPDALADDGADEEIGQGIDEETAAAPLVEASQDAVQASHTDETDVSASELESAQVETDPEHTEAHADPDSDAPDAGTPEDVLTDAEPVSEVEPLQLVPELAAEPQPETGFVFGSMRGADAGKEPLSAKIEALETVVGNADEQWEPDGVGGDDYSGTPVETLTWEDHTEDDSEAAKSEQSSAEPVSATTVDDTDSAFEDPEVDQGLDADVIASDETIMDEESLRELVSDIVREELQGALGERITRNVRKLVRREIHRAMTAQDFD